MSVYIDNARIPYGRSKMSHLTADAVDELHAFAHLIGLRREWFQDHPRHPHYDVSASKRKLALRSGALPVSP